MSAILFALFVAAELIQERPMVDFALFRKRTFLGASFAMLGFAASAQVMMTYLPLYLQNVFALTCRRGPWHAALRAAAVLLPADRRRSRRRISGRDLLALGLAIVAAGNLRQPPWCRSSRLTGSSRSACWSPAAAPGC